MQIDFAIYRKFAALQPLCSLFVYMILFSYRVSFKIVAGNFMRSLDLLALDTVKSWRYRWLSVSSLYRCNLGSDTVPQRTLSVG